MFRRSYEFLIVVIVTMVVTPALLAGQEPTTASAKDPDRAPAAARTSIWAPAAPANSSWERGTPPQATKPVNFSRKIGTAGDMIQYKSGRLTLKATDQPVGTVVNLIMTGTRLPILDIGKTLDLHKVSFDFRDLPIDQAVKLVLRDYDTFFLYGRDSSGETVLQRVWLYPQGRGQDFDPVPFEACVSSKELRATALHSRDLIAKGHALDALLSREGKQARDVVTEMISSRTPEDRNLALYYAGENNIDIPPSTLSYIAVSDSLPANRVMALDALASVGGDELEPLLQRAMTDPDPAVRSRAQEIMYDLHPPAPPPRQEEDEESREQQQRQQQAPPPQ